MDNKLDTTPVSNNDRRLIQFVLNHCNIWRDHRDANYLDTWEEYERLWRGIWAENDKTRGSERSRIITPAVRQAIESRQAEIEEAIFGRKDWFDIEDEKDPNQNRINDQFKQQLIKDFKKDKIKKNITQISQLGEVYGSGIGELIIKQVEDLEPATQPLPGVGIATVGTKASTRTSVQLKPVNPKNFIVDPNATDIDDALGCAIEEYVGVHTLIQGMVNGIYRTVNLQSAQKDPDLDAVQEEMPYDKSQVKILRYYGLVPKDLLENDDETAEENDTDEALEAEGVNSEYAEDYGDMVEAIVVIAEEQWLLKKEASPYMMKDRPLVIYRPEIIAGRFWGCGTVEKGYNMQKALDGEVRMHLDASALAAAPMMGMDATRMPRGFKFEVKPGKSVLTNGDPKDVLFPFNFGKVDPVNIQTAQLFERYLQQATGTLDSSGLPQQVGNQADAGGMAIAVSGIIKKHKRSLINFQEDFLIPFIKKTAYRYMQFDPDRYPVKNFGFIPTSTLGIMAREYEQQQFIALLQTLGPQSPIVPLVLQGIIENSSLSKREDLVQALAQMSQPNPQQQQAAQQMQLLQQQLLQAQVREANAKAMKAEAEAQAVPVETKAKLVSALSNNIDESRQPNEFERRAKLMEFKLKDKELNIKQADSIRNFEGTKIQAEVSKQAAAFKHHETAMKEHTNRIKIEKDAEGRVSAITKE